MEHVEARQPVLQEIVFVILAGMIAITIIAVNAVYQTALVQAEAVFHYALLLHVSL